MIPTRCDVLQVRVQEASKQVEVVCEGGATFSFPEQDCVLLPLEHTTCEELAEYFWQDLLHGPSGLGNLLLKRGVQWLEVSVSERPGQGACYREQIRPVVGRPESRVSMRSPAPQPCFGKDETVGLQQAELGRGFGRSTLAQDSLRTGEAFDAAEAAYRTILTIILGEEEASRPELDKTPKRAAKALREMTAGLQVRDPKTVMGDALFDVEEAHDLVSIRDIPFHSLCEHHLLPFSGTAHVGYFPNGVVAGLSKVPRLVHVLARRPQIQERLTAQIAGTLAEVLQPRALAVAMEATHACMSCRGVGVSSVTRTLALRGPSRDEPSLKESLLTGVAFSAQHNRARL